MTVAQNPTIRAYARHQANWIAWCSAHGIDPLAPSPDVLRDHLLDLGTRFAHQTVSQYCAAILSYHHAAGLEVSPVQSVSALRAVRDLRAAAKKPPAAILLSPHTLRRLLEDREIPSGRRRKALRDQALFSVLWAGNLRPSEVVRLETSHIVKYAHDRITLWLDGHSIVIDDGPPARAVSRLTEWLKESRIVTGRLFRNVPKGGRVGEALTEMSVSRRFKSMLREINISPERYSLVSFRKGSVSSRGVDVPPAPVRHQVSVPAMATRRPGVSMEEIQAAWAAADAGQVAQ